LLADLGEGSGERGGLGPPGSGRAPITGGKYANSHQERATAI
jgi:hypothetical protein